MEEYEGKKLLKQRGTTCSVAKGDQLNVVVDRDQLNVFTKMDQLNILAIKDQLIAFEERHQMIAFTKSQIFGKLSFTLMQSQAIVDCSMPKQRLCLGKC